MNINFFFPERVIALLADGQRTTELRAQIEGANEILIHGDSVALVPGDIIVRALKNGIEERYEILDVHFQSRVGASIPAITTLQVRKQGSRVPQHSSNTHISVTGIGARVNLNSYDSSANSYQTNSDEIFKALLLAISKLEEGSDKQKLQDAATELRENVGTKQYGSSFQKFMSVGANFIPLITPFMSELAKHLG